ncbi:zinc ribbon domain-containing protein [bacterium]|nr:zinc ribbon domain-containing protein [bacterium]
MQCPKCHTKVSETQAICPKCKKVLLLDCPNCHTLGKDSICQECGYTILTKCSKCGKRVPTFQKTCKCGFPTQTSLAHQECEIDEFASIIIKFDSLKTIKKALKSKELYSKFFFKLKNLLYSQLKDIDCKLIVYGNTFVVNMNKELSFSTSSNKAIRLALKIINAFVDLNSNIINELSIPLKMSLTIIKKSSEELLDLTTYENNVKPLIIKKDLKKYLKGLQIILDQHVRDQIYKEYKTDSIYSQEENGITTMFYEVMLDSYILPPSSNNDECSIKVTQKDIHNVVEGNSEKDAYSFKIFDINAKCSFEETSTTNLFNFLAKLDLIQKGKIIGIKSTQENALVSSDLVRHFEGKGYNVLYTLCTEEIAYKPWGILENIFRDYFKLPSLSKSIDLKEIDSNSLNIFKSIFDLISKKPVKAMSPEDARFNYLEVWGKFLSILKNTVIIIDGFENIDDTTVQTLELYFDKFKKVIPNFVFLTNKDISVHSKIKGLLRTPIYTEITLLKSSMDSCLETLNSDATDFIQSFFFEKIKENFNGSYLYFKNALEYLKESDILIEFENRLLIKNKKSAILPKNLKDLLKARIKHLNNNANLSLILAYTSILGYRIDVKTLNLLGIKELENNITQLEASNFIRKKDELIYINNFDLILPVISNSLKKEAEDYLIKNIIAQLGKDLDDTLLAFIMGRIGFYKEEYLTLWKNAEFSITTGDYDSYLINCLGFLSLIDYIKSDITQEEVDENKKEVYNKILMYLYSYSPTKIYFIEKILLMDAIESGDNERIVKLSNLMLQGALISSNYSEALGLLHNILSNMSQATITVDGVVNTKFLLLSLVHIEILYNIGDFRQCIDVGNEILSVLSYEILDKIKPASFSTNFFVTHIIETLRLVGLAKLFTMDNDLETFFEKVHNVLNTEFPEKTCILAIKDFLAGKIYETGNIEESSAYSKIIFLILQEFSILKDDYCRFAQNIYQAKLLANDTNQKELEMFCDLLIGYAYSKIGINTKAKIIYNDIREKAEKSMMFNIILISKLFLAQISESSDEILLLVNDSFKLMRKFNNQAKIMFAIFEKFYIDITKALDLKSIDFEQEEQKLVEFKENLAGIIN